MRCLIVVLNWRAVTRTVACVLSLVEHVLRNGHNIIVVNNDSSQSSLEELSMALREAAPTVFRDTPGQGSDGSLYVINSGANGGYAFGNNQGIRWADANRIQYDAVWILNNDALVKEDALSPMLKMLTGDRQLAFVGSQIFDIEDEGLQCSGGVIGFKSIAFFWNFKGKAQSADAKKPKQDKLVYLTGASLLVPRSTIVRHGLMDESFFLYFEEAEWQERAIRDGWRIAYCDESRIFHEKSGTVGAASAFFYYMYSRSAILYLDKTGRPLLPVAMLWIPLLCLLKTRRLDCMTASLLGVRDAIFKSNIDWSSEFFRAVNAQLPPRASFLDYQEGTIDGKDY